MVEDLREQPQGITRAPAGRVVFPCRSNLAVLNGVEWLLTWPEPANPAERADTKIPVRAAQGNLIVTGHGRTRKNVRNLRGTVYRIVYNTSILYFSRSWRVQWEHIMRIGEIAEHLGMRRASLACYLSQNRQLGGPRPVSRAMYDLEEVITYREKRRAEGNAKRSQWMLAHLRQDPINQPSSQPPPAQVESKDVCAAGEEVPSLEESQGHPDPLRERERLSYAAGASAGGSER